MCKEFFCVCCKRAGLRDRGGKNNTLGSIHIDYNVYYGRCDECHEKDIRLCVNSYLDDKLCWRVLKGLMILREYIVNSNYNANVIPYEIFGYIVGVIACRFDNGNKIACIEHMFK